MIARGEGAAVSISGKQQIKLAIERDQLGDPNALSDPPEKIAHAFADERLDRWVSQRERVLKRINCPNFQTNLYALIVPEASAKDFAENECTVDTLVEVVCAVAQGRDDAESDPGFATVLYADTPPFGRSPNTPIAVVACGMSTERLNVLWSALLDQSGLAELKRLSLSKASKAMLLLTNAEVPIAEPRVPSERDIALFNAVKRQHR
jgi:hypothetical protein